MRKWLTFVVLVISSWETFGQRFQLVDPQEQYQAGLSESLRIPIQIKNNSDKPQFYIIRKAEGELSTSQKGYFCLDNNCLEPGMDEFSKRIEPGTTLTGLAYVIETGLVGGQQNFRFQVFVRGNEAEILEQPVLVFIEEKVEKPHVFQSREITIHDVYPNPASDQAFIDYRLHDESIKAKVVIHNILGRAMGDYDLPYFESRIKLYTEDLAAGVYFYTLYLDNDGVLTRKLIIRK